MRLLLALLPFFALAAEPKPIRVLVWDEQQPQQAQGYGDKFLGETLAAGLVGKTGLTIKTAKLADPEQGLSDQALDETDVLVFWCHRKVKEQDDARVEAVVKRVQAGKLGFISLHSAHWAKPFVRLMQERSKDDALKQLSPEERATAKWVFVNEAPYYKGVKSGAPLTPSVKRDGNTYTLTLPQCVFPGYRADAKPGHMTTVATNHPIAANLPAKWDIPQTEMYDEPFHVPAPDAVVFEERWDKGEHFRSGMTWQVGAGKVFYYRPGHETYPIFKQPENIKVVENAVRWAAGK
ncbi:MAG: ThuA domain-containing protein [Opitutales bacterium]|nr:ThuA domain-containing protein [Opitutales bacterium]